jgi:hypothetical protein
MEIVLHILSRNNRYHYRHSSQALLKACYKRHAGTPHSDMNT